MFEIGVAAHLNLEDSEPLRLEFCVSFHRVEEKDDDTQSVGKQPYKYYVCLNNFKVIIV